MRRSSCWCWRSRSRNRRFAASFFDQQSGFGEPLFEDGNSIVAPERLALEEEQRHTEHVVLFRLPLRLFIVARAVSRKIASVVGGGEPDTFEHAGDSIGMIDFK